MTRNGNANALELVRDFVNTLDVEARQDSLASRRDLGRWLRAHGIAGSISLHVAVEVREALRELLLANNHLPADVERASAVLDAAARRAGLRIRFDSGAARVEGDDGLGGLLAQAAEAMRSPDWPRLKACRAATCRWAFLDQARNHSRAWCSMAVCGNRCKVQRYRERHARVS